MSGMSGSARLLRHVLTVLSMVPTPDSATVGRAELAVESSIMKGGDDIWTDDPVNSIILKPGELRTVVVPPVDDGASQNPISRLFSHRQCLQTTGTTTPLDHETQSLSSLHAKAACFHPSDSDRGEPIALASDSDVNCYVDTDGELSCYYYPNILESFEAPSTETTTSANTSTHVSTTITAFSPSDRRTITSTLKYDTARSNYATLTSLVPLRLLTPRTLFASCVYIINEVPLRLTFSTSTSWRTRCMEFVWRLLVCQIIMFILGYSTTMAALAVLTSSIAYLVDEWFEQGNDQERNKRMLKAAFAKFGICCTYVPSILYLKDPVDILRPVLFDAYNLRFNLSRPERTASRSGDTYSADRDSVNKDLASRPQFDLSLWLETCSSVFERSICPSSMPSPPLHVSPPPSPSASSQSLSISEPSLTFSDSMYDASCSFLFDESDGSVLAGVDSPNLSKKWATANKNLIGSRSESSSQFIPLLSGETMGQVSAENHRKCIAMRAAFDEDTETDVQPTRSREDGVRSQMHESTLEALLHQTVIVPTADGEDD